MPALTRALHGRRRVARTLRAWARQGARIPGATIRRTTVNGQPGGLVVDGEGRLVGVMALEIDEGRIRSIASIVNPEKLARMGPVGDLRSVLRHRGA